MLENLIVCLIVIVFMSFIIHFERKLQKEVSEMYAEIYWKYLTRRVGLNAAQMTELLTKMTEAGLNAAKAAYKFREAMSKGFNEHKMKKN